MLLAPLLVYFTVVPRRCTAFPPSYFEARTSNVGNHTLSGFSTAQLVDVSGSNAFLPPGEGDFRGPCPGLNALANHNFIPHNGVVTFTAAILQSNRGMSDFSSFRRRIE